MNRSPQTPTISLSASPSYSSSQHSNSQSSGSSESSVSVGRGGWTCGDATLDRTLDALRGHGTHLMCSVLLSSLSELSRSWWYYSVEHYLHIWKKLTLSIFHLALEMIFQYLQKSILISFLKLYSKYHLWNFPKSIQLLANVDKGPRVEGSSPSKR